MLLSLLALGLTQTQPVPPEAAEAAPPIEDVEAVDEPAPPARSSRTQDPDVAWPDEGLTVSRPGYGMDVEGVSSDGNSGRPAWTLTKKTWQEMLREDPELARLHRRGRLRGSGIALLAIGGGWLVISSAVAIDGYYATSAVGALGQWFIPGTLAMTGGIMTIIGVRARRELHERRRKLYIAPYASRTSGGLTFTGRF